MASSNWFEATARSRYCFAFAVVGFRQVLALRRDVGHVVDGRGGDGLVFLREVLQRAPQPGEGDLLVLGEVLLAEAQHAVPVQRFLQLPDQLRAGRLREVEKEMTEVANKID